MNTQQVVLTGVNLHYASAAFKERSLKSLLNNAIKFSKPKIALGDIHAERCVYEY